MCKKLKINFKKKFSKKKKKKKKKKDIHTILPSNLLLVFMKVRAISNKVHCRGSAGKSRCTIAPPTLTFFFTVGKGFWLIPGTVFHHMKRVVQSRSVVHNVVLYHWGGAQRSPHKPRQTDRHTDASDSITSTADMTRELMRTVPTSWWWYLVKLSGCGLTCDILYSGCSGHQNLMLTWLVKHLLSE